MRLFFSRTGHCVVGLVLTFIRDVTAMKTKERGTTVLTSAAVTLADGDKAKL